MKLDTSDYYPWGDSRKRPAENVESRDTTLIEVAGQQSSESSSQVEDGDTEIICDTKVNEMDVNESEHPHAPKGTITLFAHLLSWIFSPVVVPTLGIIAVFYLSMLTYAPAKAKWIIAAIVFSLTCVIPCAAIFVLTKFGDVKDMALTRRSDRLYPYIITLSCLLACGYYLTTTGLPNWVGFFYIGAALATGVNLIVNFWWKISAHGAGMGGLIALLMVLNRYGLPSYNLWGWVVAAVVAGGLLGAARVWLHRHTPMQTICGETVGFLCVIAMESFYSV